MGTLGSPWRRRLFSQRGLAQGQSCLLALNHFTFVYGPSPPPCMDSGGRAEDRRSWAPLRQARIHIWRPSKRIMRRSPSRRAHMARPVLEIVDGKKKDKLACGRRTTIDTYPRAPLSPASGPPRSLFFGSPFSTLGSWPSTFLLACPHDPFSLFDSFAAPPSHPRFFTWTVPTLATAIHPSYIRSLCSPKSSRNLAFGSRRTLVEITTDFAA